MDLDGDLAGADFTGDLLVHQAARGHRHDLAFARRQRGVARRQVVQRVVALAPPFMARTDIGMSPWPVMKMIGSATPSRFSSAWKSRPLTPCKRTSSSKQ